MRDARRSQIVGRPAPVAHRERVRRMIAELGEPATVAQLKISRPTLGRVVGGLNVAEGTLSLLRERLDAGPKGESNV